MALTPEQIAKAVLRDRRGRGKIFNLREYIWQWLLSTNWFETEYPDQIPDQVNLVDEVEGIIRTKWAAKAADTRERTLRSQPFVENSTQLKLDL